jgi:hypothetical protein
VVDSGISGRLDASVASMKDTYASISLTEALSHGLRAVARTVIDNDDFEIGKSLGEYGLDGCVEVPLGIERGNDNGNSRHVSAISRCALCPLI